MGLSVGNGGDLADLHPGSFFFLKMVLVIGVFWHQLSENFLGSQKEGASTVGAGGIEPCLGYRTSKYSFLPVLCDRRNREERLYGGKQRDCAETR